MLKKVVHIVTTVPQSIKYLVALCTINAPNYVTQIPSTSSKIHYSATVLQFTL